MDRKDSWPNNGGVGKLFVQFCLVSLAWCRNYTLHFLRFLFLLRWPVVPVKITSLCSTKRWSLYICKERREPHITPSDIISRFNALHLFPFSFLPAQYLHPAWEHSPPRVPGISLQYKHHTNQNAALFSDSAIYPIYIRHLSLNIYFFLVPLPVGAPYHFLINTHHRLHKSTPTLTHIRPHNSMCKCGNMEPEVYVGEDVYP